MMIALLAGLAAGALWALAFMAPGLIAPFGAGDLTLMRYGVFGLSSVVVLALRPARRWLPIARRHWCAITLLALTGNTLYYLLLSGALQRAGTLLPTMVIGALPVVMAVLGGWLRGVFSARRFMVPAFCILSGVALRLALSMSPGAFSVPPFETLIGLLLSLAALASWTFYGIANARLLGSRQATDLVAWTALTGVASLVTLLPFIPWLSVGDMAFSALQSSALITLILWGGVLGLLSSWLAGWLWNLASRSLSSEILGYLIVSETIFAIVYAFILAWRLPSPAEWLSMGLLILGVVVGVRRARAPA